MIDSLWQVGGQCTALYPEKYIYDIPGYKKITAADLIENLKQQSDTFAPTYHLGYAATKIEKHKNGFFITTEDQKKIECKAVIISAGVGAFDYNKLPIASAKQFEGKTLFYSIKNKDIFKNRSVVIAGGGDSAADWAFDLCDIAKKVYLVHRRSKFRCLDSTLEKITTTARVMAACINCAESESAIYQRFEFCKIFTCMIRRL